MLSVSLERTLVPGGVNDTGVFSGGHLWEVGILSTKGKNTLLRE